MLLLEPHPGLVSVWTGTMAVPIAVQSAQIHARRVMEQEGVAVYCASTMRRRMEAELVYVMLIIGPMRMLVSVVLVTSLAAAVLAPPAVVPAI